MMKQFATQELIYIPQSVVGGTQGICEEALYNVLMEDKKSFRQPKIKESVPLFSE